MILPYSPVESEVDLDLGYIENVLTDYDSQHLQKQESIMMPPWHPWATLTIQYGIQEGCHLLRPYSTMPIKCKFFYYLIRNSQQPLYMYHMVKKVAFPLVLVSVK